MVAAPFTMGLQVVRGDQPYRYAPFLQGYQIRRQVGVHKGGHDLYGMLRLPDVVQQFLSGARTDVQVAVRIVIVHSWIAFNGVCWGGHKHHG